MNAIKLNLIKAEQEAQKIIVEKHFEVVGLLDKMLDTYIKGFNLIPSLDSKQSDTIWTWLFLIMRTFYSLRCSIELMKKAYYAQAMALIRIVTEAYFLCGNCENDQTIADAILRNKPNRPDGRTIFNYRNLADSMGALVVYDKDYVFECEFAHTSNLSVGIMTTKVDASNRELRPIPKYDEILFMACCELSLKNGILMSSFLEKLLDSVSKEKVNAWRLQSKKGIREILDWLDSLKHKYGSEEPPIEMA